MPLTLNQFLLLILTIAAAVAATFLITLFIQLRKTAREGEKTLKEFRDLVNNLKVTDQKIKMRIDDIGEMIHSSKKAASNLSEISWFVTKKIIRPTSRK